MIKKSIGWLLTWLFYWIGHLLSLPMNKWDWAAKIYPVYNWFMVTSVRIQLWAGINGPWSNHAA